MFQMSWFLGKSIKRKKDITINSIDAVVRNKICNGCGACTVICPKGSISFVYGERYNFPKVDENTCLACSKCLKVCPSAFLLEGTEPVFKDKLINESYDCFLIHAKDDGIRINSASGGFITGVILHLIENGIVDGGIVARCEGDTPLVAQSFIAMDSASIISARGSKYVPVSSCTALKEVLERPGRYVFVGTPCMVEGLTRLQKFLPELRKRIVLTISFVCAGMASRLPTRTYIEKDGGVNIKDVYRISYRGSGWPGRFQVFGKNGKTLMDRPLIGGSLTHVVGRDHYLRCENCLDHWAHFADIIVSDPWTKDMVKNETKGRSAIMVRTERGQQAVTAAIEGGNLAADRITVEDMIGYNKHLLIDSKHERHSWMAWYQVVFFRRVKYLIPLMGYLMQNKIRGIRTTIRAFLNKKYYY